MCVCMYVNMVVLQIQVVLHGFDSPIVEQFEDLRGLLVQISAGDCEVALGQVTAQHRIDESLFLNHRGQRRRENL